MSEDTNSQGRRLVKSVTSLKLRNLLIFSLLVAIGLFAVRVYIQIGISPTDRNKPLIVVIQLLTEWLSGAAIPIIAVIFVYQWLVRHGTQRALELFLEEQLKKQETAIVNSVIIEIPRTLILNEEIQNRLLAGNNRLIEDVLRNFISLRLGDKIMGEGLYEGLLSKSFSYPERYLDYRNEIIISSITDDHYSKAVRKRFYNVTLNIKYRTRLQTSEIRFARAFNVDQYNQRIRDIKYRYVLLFPKSSVFPEKKAILDITSFKIDDEEFKPIETEIDGTHEWVIDGSNFSGKINTEVVIQYSISTKTYRYGHSFVANIVKPTHGSLFIFNYAQSDIAHAAAYDFFVSSKVPRIYKTPASKPQMIFVEIDEWVFPKGGVVFTWTLEEDRRIIAEAEKDIEE